MIPEKARLAVVVSHPAHLITITGILLKWKPQILMLTESPSAGSGETKQIEMGLSLIGLKGHSTLCDFDESEGYRQAIAHNYTSHIALSDRIYEWLLKTEPEVVLGDAYEASNFQHDIGRLMLDDAIKRYREGGRQLTNYEFPLSSRSAEPGSPHVYGRFLTGTWNEYALTDGEEATKRQVIAWARNQSSFIEKVAERFPPFEVERYRRVPPDRDYHQAPEGLALHYDLQGEAQVSAGNYETAIRFDEHFRPLVEALANR